MERIERALPSSRALALLGRWISPGLRRHVDPEDVWQETLAEAWKDQAATDALDGGGLGAWLLQLARNRLCDCADRGSAAKRGGKVRVGPLSLSVEAAATHTAEAAPFPPGPVLEPDPQEAAILSEVGAQVWAAVETLPEDLRRIVRLRFWEGRSLEEIGHEVGMHPGSVRRRLHKATGMLERRLGRSLP